MNSRIQELQLKIQKANVEYYTEGQTNIEDALYDQWKDELAQLNPGDPLVSSVGDRVQETILQKRAHRIPMGSQFKASNEAEFRKWIEVVGREETYHASYKMDGGSFSFEYQAGRLVSAISRGNGLEGEDITANAVQFQGLPSMCKLPTGQPFEGFVRGEVVMHVEDWKQVDPEQLKNPRNTGLGIARRKNGEQSELLTVYVFRVFDPEGELLGETEQEQSEIIKSMGFNAAPYTVGKPDDIWAWFRKTHVERPTLPYWIDGIVIKLNDIAKQTDLGETDNRPKGQVALKFEAEGQDTVLRELQVATGHSGAVVPVAIFDPVELGGSTVTCATLCNWDNIRELNIGIGDTIRVIKAGDIIPRIMTVVRKAAEPETLSEPTQCPSCSGPVGHRSNVSGEKSVILYCLNPECPAKLYGKIARFVESLNILGAGESILKSAILDLGVRDAADLYTLHTQREALAGLRLNGKVKLGENRADRLLAEIEKARKLTLSQFLGSLGVFSLGKRKVALIQAAAPETFDHLENWFSGTLLKLASQVGLPNTAQSIQAGLDAQQSLVQKFLANGLEIVKPEAKPEAKAGAFTICITGKLSQPKAHFWELIATAGHVSTDEFSKTVTHLVAAEPTGTSGKLAKARKMGIPILSEAELINLLKA
jgi:DNA ligase (NAD+)